MSSSRPYRVKVRASIQETVVKDDSVTSKLDIVPILSSDQQEAITRGILSEHGFQDDDSNDSGSMSRERNGVSVTINPSTGDIEARAEQSESIDLSEEDEVDEGGCPCRVRNKADIEESMRRRLAKKAQGIHKSVQELVTGKLLGELSDIACEMEQVANQVTKRALKTRAQEIGNIKSIHHDDNTGGMTIVVEV